MRKGTRELPTHMHLSVNTRWLAVRAHLVQVSAYTIALACVRWCLATAGKRFAAGRRIMLDWDTEGCVVDGVTIENAFAIHEVSLDVISN